VKVLNNPLFFYPLKPTPLKMKKKITPTYTVNGASDDLVFQSGCSTETKIILLPPAIQYCKE
jgi:hypothetical protein